MLEILEEARARGAGARARRPGARGTSCSPSSPASCRRAELDSETPYLLTYTSGTTGKPKGVVHVQGGFLVSIAREVCYQADARPGDVIHFATDMGWIMGPWTVVGGHALGATLVFAEGAPDFPPDRLWRLIEDERVSILGLSPTLVRALIPHGDPETDLSSLRDDRDHRRAVEPRALPLALRAGGRLALPDHQLLGRDRGRRLLPLAHARDPDQGVLARRAGARDGDGRRRRRGPLARGQRRGRRARLPQAVPGHDARVLARPGALPRDLLVAVSRACGRTATGPRWTRTASGSCTAAPTTR